MLNWDKKSFLGLISVTLVFILFLLAPAGCAPRKQRFTKNYIDYFDTVVTVIGYEKNREIFDDNCNAVEKTLKEYHQYFDIYHEYEGVNNIFTVNKNAGISPVKVDKPILDLLVLGKELTNKTNGKFNIAFGSVLSVWHKYRKAGLEEPESVTIPYKSELEEAALHCAIDKLKINAEDSTVFIVDENMRLDVGAIAKGFAADAVVGLLENRGAENYAVNMGGMVSVIGLRGDGKPWNTGIQNPKEDGALAVSVKLSRFSLITSGSYQRFYTVDGERYHHIIDPETLMPKNDYLSVSVICDNCVVGDALSTAVFNMSEDDGKKLLSQMDAYGAMWIKSDGSYSYYGDFEKYITK